MPSRDFHPTIVRLLSNLASAKEIQQYLRRFAKLDRARFAIVKVGGAILRDDLDSLVSSLSFLQQVGLTPIVIHGPELASAGAEKRTPRATPEMPVLDPDGPTRPTRSLSIVRRALRADNLRLVEALQAEGVRATSVLSGVFEAEPMDGPETRGFVGRVTRVDLEGIQAAIRARSIPVIASIAETPGGQILDVDADLAANALIRTLEPYKIVFLTSAGGLLSPDGHVIDSINLSTEYEELRAQPWLHPEMKLELEQIHDLLESLPPSSSVSITRPEELAKELFTHRGSGTLVRRGEAINRFERWDDVDRSRLRELVESSFGRRLTTDYFEKTGLYRLYVSEHFRAGLILTMEEGMPHLDKFAVAEGAQGEGLGRAIWRVMRHEIPRLFWRSRPNNPVNEFYFGEADGCLKGERWTVFWYGLESFEQIRTAVEHCRGRPATLKP
ncbi:MAG: acetylglutamate kinase [Deltaproteobacteria bacterium]|nr:acetylglutamate kinase [Deltaproteobacteria bacterium]